MSKELIEIRKQAEAAVDDMPEGELKTKAFETILTHLLSNVDGAKKKDTGPAAAKVTPRIKEKGHSVGKVPTSAEGRIVFLKGENFFGTQRSIAEIRQELKKSGWHYATTALSGRLQSLVQKRLLRREKVADNKQRAGWKYSNP
jgi:hypothetical protein